MPGALSRRSALSFLGAMAAAGGGGWPAAAAEPDPAAGPRAASGPTPGPAARVDTLIGRMTLEEKVSLLHGAKDPLSLGQAGYTPGVPRLGIPPLRLADGPAGVRVARHATALPAPVLLASAFDPALAREYGRTIGREGRALGQDVLLSPMVNLIRTPYAGRDFETFGEDPLLTSQLVAEEIRGIQAEGLIATVKHFALNNQEHERESIDVVVDERTLREMELPGFESAVRAGAGAVMGAYNKVNGAFACESGPLLTGVLRTDWGFDGWVMTDWHAAHSTAAALGAGLDMEMPDGEYFGEALRKAVADGAVPEAQVDRAVGRVLTVMDRFGLLDGGAPPRPGRDPGAGARTALKVATAGGVLLRNERGTLPLTGPAARSIAVVGPTGAIPFVSGGGSAHVVPDHAASPLETIRERAGEGARVDHALGEDVFGKTIPATALSPATGLEERKVAARKSWTYDGTLTVDESDEWTFVLHFSGPPAGRPKVLLDDEELFPFRAGLGEYFTGGFVSATPDGLAVRRTAVALTAGKHRLKVTAKGGSEGLAFRLRRTTSATRAADVAEAVRTARAAHRVVLFAYEDATEGRDRTTIALPGHQNALITAVTEANPHTTVVLNTSSCTAMPWLERTGAVLQMYYPGQEGAAATTALLFGDANPSGRLTQTFPVSDDRHPMAGGPRRYPGVDGREEYSEGIHVGYRWYDAEGVRPLFPFGHGLSYTTFAYAGLRLRRHGNGLEAAFTVHNTGSRAGAEVAQVYVGPSPDLPLPQAERALAGYRRVHLRPGEARTVTVRMAARTLSSWDTERHRWVLGTGPRTVEVGSSSRDPRLRGRIEVRHRG
ncbi:glycoside hydrolase family 3 C-terminal domain-containing protein [Streptomyces malaysiensis subsp. malaysiensis]|uniref:beta-glucosidase family protein n=1 Tax=Streptomyces malaysiensis TaxID=92644 RepID=UPI0024C07B99|nr:glycoside hydrolase family 3 C-terminal domain-containing protein [Streptomyces sp. NA07423]WHX23041.1 glycoside hydrolase family 3 C-terminal domain-containing protein [Streptomyces sp. NA07423]